MTDFVRLRFDIEGDAHRDCMKRFVTWAFADKIPEDVTMHAVRCIWEGGWVVRRPHIHVIVPMMQALWAKFEGHKDIPLRAVVEDHDGIVPIAVLGSRVAELIERLDDALDTEKQRPRIEEPEKETTTSVVEIPPELGRILLSVLKGKRSRDDDDGGSVH